MEMIDVLGKAELNSGLLTGSHGIISKATKVETTVWSFDAENGAIEFVRQIGIELNRLDYTCDTDDGLVFTRLFVKVTLERNCSKVTVTVTI